MALIPFGTESTYLDEMNLGDGEIDDWVDTALSGSRDFVKEFLEMGEESLEFSAAEDELRKLQSKLNDAETRESQLKQELQVKDKRISRLEDSLDQLRKELLEERARARDEAEDMAQELAELRYQMSEALEEERMLRARTEQVSVHRVEELEHQVKLAREEAVVALAHRRETELQAEKEIGALRGALEATRLQLEDAQNALNQQAVCERCPVYLDEAERVKAEVSELTLRLQQQDGEVLALKKKVQRSVEESPNLCSETMVDAAEPEVTSSHDRDVSEVNREEQAEAVLGETIVYEPKPEAEADNIDSEEFMELTPEGLEASEEQEENLAGAEEPGFSTEKKLEIAGDSEVDSAAENMRNEDMAGDTKVDSEEQETGMAGETEVEEAGLSAEDMRTEEEQEESSMPDDVEVKVSGFTGDDLRTEEQKEEEVPGDSEATGSGPDMKTEEQTPEESPEDMKSEEQGEERMPGDSEVKGSEEDMKTEEQDEERMPGDSEVKGSEEDMTTEDQALENSPEEEHQAEDTEVQESGLTTEDPRSDVSPEEATTGDTGFESREFYSSQIETLERKISQVHETEVQLQLERGDLLSEVAELRSQVEHFRLQLELAIQRHSEALVRLDKERTLLQEETEATKAALSGEITQLQHALEEKGAENESLRGELEEHKCNLEKETDRALELAARIKAVEAELQSERVLYSEAASKCVDLTHSLDRTTQKLLTVEAELEVSRSENEVLQKALNTAEDQLLESTREKHAVEEDLQRLTGQLQAQEQRGNRFQQELVCQKAASNLLAGKVGELSSEVLTLQQRLITCQTQVSEMAMKNVILEDTVAAKKRKIKEGEQRMILQAEKMGRQEEKFFGLQAKFSALQNDFSALEAKLGETRRREQEMRIQMERLSLELSMAKHEVVNSEVRLQKAMKQAKEQLEAEAARHAEVVNKHRQSEWFLNRKIEHLERSEMEKEQLQEEIWRLRSIRN